MRRTALAATLFAAWLSTGCMTFSPVADSALGGAAFSYSAGRATQDFAFPPSALQSSITSAMDDLRISSVRLTNDAGTLIYHGTTADDRRATVTIRPNQGISRVSIRIGWLGDEALSRALMDRIGIRLGTLPPSAIPVDPPSTPGTNPYFSREAIPDSVMLKDQADAIYRDKPVP